MDPNPHPWHPLAKPSVGVAPGWLGKLHPKRSLVGSYRSKLDSDHSLPGAGTKSGPWWRMICTIQLAGTAISGLRVTASNGLLIAGAPSST